jgi:phosphoserine phosphatase
MTTDNFPAQLDPIIKAVDRELGSAESMHPYAVFDFDDTCVIHDIQQAWMAYVCRHGLIRYPRLLGDEARELDAGYHEAVFRHYWDMIHRGVTFEAYVYALRTLVGYRPDEARELGARVIEAEGTTLGEQTLFGVTILTGFQVSAPVRALMDALIARGVRVCITSASPKVLVEEALRHDGFPETDCIGTELETEAGFFADRIVAPTPVEHGKIECLEARFGTVRPLVGVGDTMNDFAVLENAVIPVAVDRGNPLADEARRRGWHLITHTPTT